MAVRCRRGLKHAEVAFAIVAMGRRQGHRRPVMAGALQRRRVARLDAVLVAAAVAGCAARSGRRRQPRLGFHLCGILPVLGAGDVFLGQFHVAAAGAGTGSATPGAGAFAGAWVPGDAQPNISRSPSLSLPSCTWCCAGGRVASWRRVCCAAVRYGLPLPRLHGPPRIVICLPHQSAAWCRPAGLDAGRTGVRAESRHRLRRADGSAEPRSRSSPP